MALISDTARRPRQPPRVGAASSTKERGGTQLITEPARFHGSPGRGCSTANPRVNLGSPYVPLMGKGCSAVASHRQRRNIGVTRASCTARQWTLASSQCAAPSANENLFRREAHFSSRHNNFALEREVSFSSMQSQFFSTELGERYLFAQ